MSNCKVIVLMSTYNGELFLKQQLESILHQEMISLELFIRDDGSQDSTALILNEYSEKYDNVHVEFGENIGWKRSFFKLIVSAIPEQNSYFAFSDQDDVWEKNKLITAVKSLNSFNKPAVYHSNVSIVDENLNKLGDRFPENFIPETKLPNSFIDSIALGCTVVFNSELLKLVQQHIPKKETQHDAYIFALGYLFGESVYDSESHIMYRRHTSATTNFTNLRNTGHPSLMMRYKRYKKGSKNNFSIRAQELLNGYDKFLNGNQRKFLFKIATYSNNFRCKLNLIINPAIHGTGLRRTLQFKYRVLNNTF